jgi:hypothetical protein
MCKLCLKEKKLQRSHLMPRALYKKSRSSGSKGNQDPLVRSARGAKRSSHQIQDYVFCWECEQRLSSYGERYVMGLVTTQKGRFPLLEQLTSVKPTHAGPAWAMYSVADSPKINRDRLAYFAISVFWRASVHSWKQEGGKTVKIDLGAKYNEQIRKYLMGVASVPQNAFLWLVICSDLENQNAFFTPGENQKNKDRSVIFLARGMLFMFRVTNTLREREKRLSMVNNPSGWLTVRDCGYKQVWQLRES